jgi:hypothetical protein
LDEEEEQLYNALLELWLVGEVTLEELYFLKKIDYGMFQPEEKIEGPFFFNINLEKS